MKIYWVLSVKYNIFQVFPTHLLRALDWDNFIPSVRVPPDTQSINFLPRFYIYNNF